MRVPNKTMVAWPWPLFGWEPKGVAQNRSGKKRIAAAGKQQAEHEPGFPAPIRHGIIVGVRRDYRRLRVAHVH
jgi:hypothetical protein